MEKVRTEPVLIKQEKLEEGLCYSDPQPTPVEVEQVTPPTPVGGPEELSEQHRCGHGDEELSGLEFVGKAEQEEEHSTDMEVRTEPVLIKQEKLEEGLCYSDPQPTPVEEEQVTQSTPVADGKKLDTEPTPVGDLEELSEQHRCGHGDEELSGLEFVWKAEQEEEHVAQRLNQTGCEPTAGRLNNLGSEYVMYEGDDQLWTSFTQEDSDILEIDGDTEKTGEADGQADFGKKPLICILQENEALKNKLQLVQHERRTMRKEEMARARESPVNTRSVGVQVIVEEQHRERVFGPECGFNLRRDGEPAGVEESANMDKVRTEPVLIKQEKLEEGLRYSDRQPTPVEEEQVTQPTPVDDVKKPDTEPTPVGDPEELSEQHRCGHGDEELSGLEFVVKAEQEEEHSANKEKVRTEPVLIKQEKLEEGLCYSDPQPTPVEEEQVTQPTPVGDVKKPDTEPTPVGDPEELSEQHRCGHGDEELSGLEFVVKAEQEEEHAASKASPGP
ncbi:hypothetical protein COCON_G00137200 [Conger conger]|uniref:Uncharacterized protein n=1 Tax=Conger conger TaxID=82655 RepID=A0A9Q1DF60_CONCO|nr:hypothetical protein COCON_G00137200 [Conger conger]